MGEWGREVVRRYDSRAPCILLPDGIDLEGALAAVEPYGLSVLVVAHFNHERILPLLERMARPPELVVLSHGRSGKPGTSADHRLGPEPVRIGRVTVHDWSYDPDTYLHLDGFLAAGGSFSNPVPSGRPRILLLPTWPRGDRQCLLDPRWLPALAELAGEADLVISPHPLLDEARLAAAARTLGATVLPATGDSYARVPEAHVVVSDLSGAFWEALLFDTPVVLARPERDPPWSPDLPPSPERTAGVVPFSSPDDLAETARRLIGTRQPGQRSLAEQRLGRVDGRATGRVAARILALVADRYRHADRPDEASGRESLG